MTPNDSQIDILLRRHAKRAQSHSAATEHLDADELSAFAEGALPAAARARYVSHLADCAECRKFASQLSIHAGGMTAAQTSQVSTAARVPWWKSLSSLIALPALRYAAFAAVLIAVVGVTFLVWRRMNTARTDLVAQNQSTATPASAVKADTDTASNAQTAQNSQPEQSRIAKALSQPTVIPQGQEKLSQTMADAPAAPPPKPLAAGTTTETQPSLTARSTASARPETTPSFAPPPPEADEAKSREQQNVGGITHGGPRRSDYKVLDRSRSADVAKEEDRTRNVTNEDKKDKNQPKQQSENGTLSMSAGNREVRSEPRKSENKTASASEVAPSTRSAGGRKFQRQGSAWVDVKFKSSMAVRRVARGSEDFAALDSRLRSIAEQLSGEVIVVWKGKAYRIQ